jgi:hypothetical protein
MSTRRKRRSLEQIVAKLRDAEVSLIASKNQSAPSPPVCVLTALHR